MCLKLNPNKIAFHSDCPDWILHDLCDLTPRKTQISDVVTDHLGVCEVLWVESDSSALAVNVIHRIKEF